MARSMSGKWMVRPPLRCPRGHPLRPGRMLVQKITPHDLRHTCASLAVSAGVNVLALARMLGHKDPSVTLRVYADLFDTDLDAVAITLHGRYSQQNVLKMCSPGAHEDDAVSSKPSLPAQIPGQERCGRRDSNPHALSSTGT